ncbi:serine/arginine repetitive matrix protein 1-like [Drosophila kikkawai]|uniref:Serine/arginine repetitive matrix protein 1-like n=1 Tax=Drosophila kikkawai TaxID=30033 RepID=A0ABM4GKT0_DROKI
MLAELPPPPRRDDHETPAYAGAPSTSYQNVTRPVRRPPTLAAVPQLGPRVGNISMVPHCRFACRNCAQEGHRSYTCRNPRVLFCWDCGRRGIRTYECCRVLQVLSSLSVPSPTYNLATPSVLTNAFTPKTADPIEAVESTPASNEPDHETQDTQTSSMLGPRDDNAARNNPFRRNQASASTEPVAEGRATSPARAECTPDAGGILAALKETTEQEDRTKAAPGSTETRSREASAAESLYRDRRRIQEIPAPRRKHQRNVIEGPAPRRHSSRSPHTAAHQREPRSRRHQHQEFAHGGHIIEKTAHGGHISEKPRTKAEIAEQPRQQRSRASLPRDTRIKTETTEKHSRIPADGGSTHGEQQRSSSFRSPYEDCTTATNLLKDKPTSDARSGQDKSQPGTLRQEPMLESVGATCWRVRLPNVPTPLRGKLNAPSTSISISPSLITNPQLKPLVSHISKPKRLMKLCFPTARHTQAVDLTRTSQPARRKKARLRPGPRGHTRLDSSGGAKPVTIRSPSSDPWRRDREPRERGCQRWPRPPPQATTTMIWPPSSREILPRARRRRRQHWPRPSHPPRPHHHGERDLHFFAPPKKEGDVRSRSTSHKYWRPTTTATAPAADSNNSISSQQQQQRQRQPKNINSASSEYQQRQQRTTTASAAPKNNNNGGQEPAATTTIADGNNHCRQHSWRAAAASSEIKNKPANAQIILAL